MKMTSKELAALLRDMATRVEAGDSFGGNLEYDAMVDGLDADEFEVSGAYRIGNSQGQGGMRVLSATA